jgi:exonuclease SbcC
MRLHRLSFAAIGPYPGAHDIDFDALGSSALFLIDGPTGAGKSTIIDALVFALYGDVAGDTDKERLRSAFADASTESFCEVDITAAGGRLRVRRTPAFDRAKKRGSGTTTVNASVQVWRSVGGDSWEPVSALKGEADAEILRAIGLSREQFVQTVVLPQGEFATFLRAESGERLPMLERIFATGVFRRVQDHLDEARREAERGIAQAQDARTEALQRAVGVLAGHPWQDELRTVVDAAPDDWATALDAIGHAIDDTVTEVVSAHDAARIAADAARRELDAARSMQRLERALAQAVERQAQADAALDRARADAGLAPDADPVVERTVVQSAIDDLAVVRTIEAGLAGERAGVERERDRAGRIDTTIQRLEDERETLPAQIRARADLLQARMRQAQDAVTEAEAALAVLRARRILGMAAELAQGLGPGAPCPVCGAVEHPHPAPPHDDPVTPEAIEETEHAVTGLRGQAEAERTVSANASALVDAARSVPSDVAFDADAPSEEILVDVRALAAQFADIDRTLAEQRVEAAAAAERIATAQALLATHDRQVEQGRADFESVALRIAGLEAVRGRIDAIVAAEARVQEAARVTAEQQRTLAEAVGAGAVPDDATVTALAQTDADAASRAEQAATRRTTVERLRTAFSAAVSEAQSAAQEVARRIDDAGPLLQVARVLNGAGGGVTLATFAVQQVFEEVVAAANARLRTMLDGRFQLVATAERTGARRVDQGLGLKVRDLVSDSERRTATLSGGETFCASLALALGLADTVRAHAGGIEIDTLFVDEGFGSLDADRLGDVMEELLRLRADGRTVGVISHVTEMRQSILERIEVVPTGRGSTLRVNWADA